MPGGRGARGPATTVSLEQSPGQLSCSLVYTTLLGLFNRRVETTVKWQPLGNHNELRSGPEGSPDHDVGWAGSRRAGTRAWRPGLGSLPPPPSPPPQPPLRPIRVRGYPVASRRSFPSDPARAGG
uniref:Uncharacterized protein n=1 Tax=Rangifer tarandus platyrhynchus TaxID=3082113 RepID=A0ACB0E047_RANTA|nr:unnamed protein product [Rangifer tarandus platyrhynchus]